VSGIRRWSVGLGVGAAMALSLLPGAAPARAAVGVRVVGQPALFPRFDPGVPDYVTRCRPGKPLRLSITGGRGASVGVDRRAARGGSFRVALRGASGEAVRFTVATGHRRRRYLIRCLPGDFPAWTAERTGQPQAAWYVVAPCCTKSTYVAIFDTHGVPVWWMNTHRPPLDASLLPDGNVVWAQQHGKDLGPGVSSGAYEEHGLNGKLLRTFSGPNGGPTDRHELQLLPNGNYVVVAYKPRRRVDLSPYGGPAQATVLDALVEEVTPRGKVAWSWNSADHVSLAETGRWYQQHVIDNPVHLNGRPAYDIVHINAVERYGAGRFLVSLRHTDAVYAIEKSSGDVVWKLGGTQTSRSLKIVGDDGPDFGGQHDIRVLPDGTITLHDNGTGLGRPPRALRFRIDPEAMTATLLEQITDPAATDSPCCGSARKLPGGHWVISWGGVHLVTEVTVTGKRVFALHFAVHMSYRAFPVLPGRLKRSALHRGMDVMHPR
jgi:arylsulfotransferase ASST